MALAVAMQSRTIPWAFKRQILSGITARVSPLRRYAVRAPTDSKPQKPLTGSIQRQHGVAHLEPTLRTGRYLTGASSHVAPAASAGGQGSAKGVRRRRTMAPSCT